ncbi:glycosyltransferase [Ramlibacter monticola]|uniref:Glycosyltransferase n=1 Tax=Ramlibacter monticola TaxID=1926872 RepID=A0A937CV75_9BURK|nr:glycosyltransferase [Ramlibacter monticola]
MKAEICASLILATKNRASGLERALAYVLGIKSKRPFEVILVDNGSSDRTPDVLNEFAARFCGRTTLLTCVRPGNSAARNDAIRVANSSLLIFIDDDCYVRPGFIDAWVDVFADPRIGFGTGSIERFNTEHSPLGCRPVHSERVYASSEWIPRGVIQGSNMAFAARCLTDIGSFDERFGAGTPWAGEDWDMAIRALRHGWRGGLFPGPVVAHDHGRGEEDALDRLQFYDYGAGATYAKHLVSAQVARVVRAFAEDAWHARVQPGRVGALTRGVMSYFFNERSHSA